MLSMGQSKYLAGPYKKRSAETQFPPHHKDIVVLILQNLPFKRALQWANVKAFLVFLGAILHK